MSARWSKQTKISPGDAAVTLQWCESWRGTMPRWYIFASSGGSLAGGGLCSRVMSTAIDACYI